MKSKPSESAFGDFIRERRVEHGHSLRAFAKVLKISPTYLSRLENNHDNTPSDRVLLGISSELNLDLASLCRLANRVPRAVQSLLLSAEKSVEFADLCRLVEQSHAEC